MSPKSQLSNAKNSFIANITLVLTTASVILVLRFFTTLNVACNSSSAFVPNNILYFTGWYIIWSDNDFYGSNTDAYEILNWSEVLAIGLAPPSCNHILYKLS